MPTYEYLCKSCGHRFDHFQQMGEKKLRKCPVCARSALERLIGAGAGILFKGSGFYETDYRRPRDAGADKTDADSVPATGRDGGESQDRTPASETSGAKRGAEGGSDEGAKAGRPAAGGAPTSGGGKADTGRGARDDSGRRGSGNTGTGNTGTGNTGTGNTGSGNTGSGNGGAGGKGAGEERGSGGMRKPARAPGPRPARARPS